MSDVIEGKAGFGLPPAVWRPVASVLAICLTLVAVLWSLNVPRALGLAFYPQQFLALILALAMPLAFLMLPFRRGEERDTVPWYDALFALISFLAVVFIAVRYPVLVNLIFSKPAGAYVPGLISILLLLEALRRTTGLSLVIIIGVFLLYALFGDLVPGRLAGRPQDWRMLSGYMAFDVNGIFGIPMAVASTVVVTFILFGSVLGITGGSRFFTDASLLAMGRFRGGSMKIAVLASMLFGSISGSAVANVTATGIVTIPLIKRGGYPAHKAGAIEAVASTGGQLMPPVMGAAAFLMAEFLQVPYAEVALAAFIPSVLYYGALFVQADLEAARAGISRVSKSAIPEKRAVLGGLHFILAFVVLIGALFVLLWQPERAALAAALTAAVTALVFGYRAVRPKLSALFTVFEDTGRSVVEIIIISAASGLVIGVLNVTGLSFNLTYALVQIGGGSAIVLLVLSAIVCIILGMGLPTLGVYVLLAALVAPAMVQVGIEPMAAHMFVLYFGMMSMITPPIAIAAFAAASIAQAPAMKTGWAAVKFGWVAFIVPFLFVYSPSLLLIGDPMEVTIAILTAGLGVWLISAALAGYFMSRLSPVLRVLFGFFGLMALIPAGAFPGAIYTDIIGVCGGIALLAMEAVRARGETKKAAT
ncbi:TRAP transporter fused permease subunit [Chelativorans sp. SCAU2101]|jgi:TRAP transporter, 4TM/12TM fusion protein|uniref:TRAP transporter fused permease subunit n=1 Tax=Chelativorans petroleitrophicus TaxID=2975484 RepID=A0A9X2X9P8_9HYPH|nr:TRAP transporter fused permease subunit [Chelativorans petroleitrophicus]MCT8991348.1 TRAP transporter fused permease subunit [Chelativorans petroleitrophicus]